MTKEHMFWSPNGGGAYADGIPVPRVTYRCKGESKITKKKRNAVKQSVTHNCKLVADHPTNYCKCICGEKFNEREESDD